MPRTGQTKLQVGDKIGELTLVEFLGSTTDGIARWRVLCDCGATVTVMASNMARKPGKPGTRTCGDRTKHARPNTRHGLASTREYAAWKGMLKRCRSSRPRERKYYKDRGITVCDEWQKSFTAFLTHIGPMPQGHRIGVDRINNDGNYEPGNVQWATPKMQCNNRRSRWRAAA